MIWLPHGRQGSRIINFCHLNIPYNSLMTRPCVDQSNCFLFCEVLHREWTGRHGAGSRRRRFQIFERVRPGHYQQLPFLHPSRLGRGRKIDWQPFKTSFLESKCVLHLSADRHSPPKCTSMYIYSLFDIYVVFRIENRIGVIKSFEFVFVLKKARKWTIVMLVNLQKLYSFCCSYKWFTNQTIIMALAGG